MCYGNVDPRYLARDIEARMAPVTAPAEHETERRFPATAGLAARLAAWFAALVAKKVTHG